MQHFLQKDQWVAFPMHLCLWWKEAKGQIFGNNLNKRYFYGPTWLSGEHWHLIKNIFTLKKVWVYWCAYKKRKIWPNFLWNNIFSNLKIKPWPKYLIYNFIDNKTPTSLLNKNIDLCLWVVILIDKELLKFSSSRNVHLL